jgi:hypothetical protein
VEERTARNWYWWLWLSPLITVPTFRLLGNAIGEALWAVLGRSADDYSTPERVSYSLGILGSSLWHLILLVPMRDNKSEFVRWHGRQALLLAGVRTAVPLGFLLMFGYALPALCSMPVLLVIWVFGTLLGQLEAARGKCSLMRCFGRADVPLSRVDALVDVIRYSRDPEERREALSKLDELGMVEPL